MANQWVHDDGYSQVAEVAGEFVVAQHDFGWLPGVYPSIAAALDGSAAYDEAYGRVTCSSG